MRIVSAKALRKRIKTLGFNKNIIVLGDFNSDYEEYKKFKRKRKLNNTNGRTGINDVLHTKNKHTRESLYNLWYDTAVDNRYSYFYRGKKEAMDNIIITPTLLSSTGIHYKKHSISTFDKAYLFKGKYPYRWKVSRARIPKHKGKGYSDHLPVTAEFVLH
jgi:predicted extracellular nuclease